MKAPILSTLSIATALFSMSVFAQTPSSSAASVDPSAFVDQFEATFGKFEGYRRSGAKGICAMGEFVATSEARTLSSASVFTGRPIPVVVRFSVGGANPKAPDNAKSQRNLALQFNLPDGEVWQMGNISSPVFGASSPQQFIGLLASRQMPTPMFFSLENTLPHSQYLLVLPVLTTGACMALVSSTPVVRSSLENGFLSLWLAFRG
jgi:catalase